MTKKLSAKVGIVITAVALIISIVAFLKLDRSLAWFSRNDQVSAQGISLSVRGQEISASLLSLGVVNITDGVYTFETDTDEATGERIQSFALPKDDPNGISYSEYSKALVLELTITLTTSRPTTIRLVADSAQFDLAQENDFSNCISVSNVSSFTENTVTKGDRTQSFVVQGQSGIEKTGEVEIYTNNALAAGTHKIYFIIEYNSVFLNHINQYILTDDTVDFFEVSYKHDVTMLIS